MIYSNGITQRIFVFESGLDRLIILLENKRYIEEGKLINLFDMKLIYIFLEKIDVTVEDCLSTLLNLLENNSLSQLWFCVHSFLSRVFAFFRFTFIHEPIWSTQKVIHAHLLLKVRDRIKTRVF